MSDQDELTCVSCDTEFDPTPSGGFCPDCDTPHPDFGVDEDEEGETTDEAGADASAASDPGATDDLEEVGTASVSDDGSVTIPGDVLDTVGVQPPGAVRFQETGDGSILLEAGSVDEVDEPDDDAAAPDESADESAGVPDEVTLVLNGERYSFGDGDSFGRRDDGWLPDLIEACGGKDEVSYVSSEHLEFSIEDDGVFVVDVSRNGTALNGNDLDGGKAKVEDGDTLKLAERAEIDVEL